MKRYLIGLLSAAFALSISPVWAQEAAPANVANDSAPAAAKAQPGDVGQHDTAAQQAAPKSDDPGDVIADYLAKMATLLQTNLDKPETLVEKFDAFVKENEKSMRNASKKFDEKLRSLKATDAEVYRETVQRKITPELNRVVGLLIDFGSRYPTESAKLDSMLKVDAKYTYQQ